MNPVHYSSKSVIWSTPPDFFKSQDAKFGFTLDVCALPENAKCKKFFTPEIDGLKQEWSGVCWMNPPYGEPEHPCKPNCKKKICEKRGYHNTEYIPGISDWVMKAYREASLLKRCTVVGLLPARTDTYWFHNFIYRQADVQFIQGRLKFGGSSNAAPFPSMIVIWR
jgi:site-specific DNA-methyltransferase (adenine-specific)